MFAAVDSSTSRTIGIVQASPFDSLPFDMTFSKSFFSKNPSRGLKIPSAMFSTSFARSSEIDIEYNPDGSVLVILFTSFPPCGLTELSGILNSLFMVYMKATFFVPSLFPPPTSCSQVFSRFNCSSTWLTSNTWISFVKKTIVW